MRRTMRARPAAAAASVVAVLAISACTRQLPEPLVPLPEPVLSAETSSADPAPAAQVSVVTSRPVAAPPGGTHTRQTTTAPGNPTPPPPAATGSAAATRPQATFNPHRTTADEPMGVTERGKSG